MKTFLRPLIGLCTVAFLVATLHSQGVAPRSTVDRLRDAKAKNAEIIEKQTATLQKLEELEKAAEQLRIFSRRS